MQQNLDLVSSFSSEYHVVMNDFYLGLTTLNSA